MKYDVPLISFENGKLGMTGIYTTNKTNYNAIKA